jgi:hypothetical protein
LYSGEGDLEFWEEEKGQVRILAEEIMQLIRRRHMPVFFR